MITQSGKPQDASDLINGGAAITVVIYVLSWYLDLQAHPFQGLKSRAIISGAKGQGEGVSGCLYVEKLNSLHPEYSEQRRLLRPQPLKQFAVRPCQILHKMLVGLSVKSSWRILSGSDSVSIPLIPAHFGKYFFRKTGPGLLVGVRTVDPESWRALGLTAMILFSPTQ